MRIEAPAESDHQATLLRLEARVRRLTALSAFLSVGFAALVAWVLLPRTSTLEARRFVLRDADWRRRAELGFRDDGGPALKLYNTEGKTRGALYLSSEGSAALWLSDVAGKERAYLGLEADGTPKMVLADEAGTIRFKAP